MALRLSKLEKTYRRNPQSILFAHLADLYLHKNQVSRALSLCEAGCELFPDYVSGFTILSKCYQARGDLEKARAAQQKALDLDPENPGGLVRLARIFRDLGRPAPALESLQQAASLDDLDSGSRELMDRLTYALRLESTGAGAAGLVDNETQLDALALEMESAEQGSEAGQIIGRNPASRSTPPAANSPEDGKTLSADSDVRAPEPEAHDPVDDADLADDSAGPEGEADLALENGNDTAVGQSPEQSEAEAISPPPEDNELIHLFQEIEKQQERKLPRQSSPAVDDDHRIATATLAQIYSDQGLVQRAVDTYKQALEKDPDNEEIKRRLAELE